MRIVSWYMRNLATIALAHTYINDFILCMKREKLQLKVDSRIYQHVGWSPEINNIAISAVCFNLLISAPLSRLIIYHTAPAC